MTEHLHTYSEPVEGAPNARQCGECGEAQVYRPPVAGQRVAEFSDVFVDKDDLRLLLAYAEDLLSEFGYPADEHGLVIRIRNLLDSAAG